MVAFGLCYKREKMYHHIAAKLVSKVAERDNERQLNVSTISVLDVDHVEIIGSRRRKMLLILK